MKDSTKKEIREGFIFGLVLFVPVALLLAELYSSILYHGETSDLGNVLSGYMYYYQQCHKERTGKWAMSYDADDECAQELKGRVSDEWIKDYPVSFTPDNNGKDVLMELTYDKIYALGLSTAEPYRVRQGLVIDGKRVYPNDRHAYAWALLKLKLRDI